MASTTYILDEHGEPIPEPANFDWLPWFKNINNRRVAKTQVGDVTVSTVFVGACSSLLFETLVSGGGMSDNEECHYATRAEAVAGHEARVEELRHRSLA